jgi:hypothetical protein
MGASSGDRFLENMNKEIKHYIETDWGIKSSILKAEARRKRSIRVKQKVKLFKFLSVRFYFLEFPSPASGPF